MSRRLLTSTQVAEILSEPEATTRRRTRQGIYDDFALNLGTDQRPRWRYDQARLERWLDQHIGRTA